MKPLSVSFSATSSVYSRIGYETVLNKRDHSSFDNGGPSEPCGSRLGQLDPVAANNPGIGDVLEEAGSG